MQLLVLILKKVELQDEIMRELAEAGITGGTVLDGTGMAKTLVKIKDLPTFGILRHILGEDEEANSKVMLFVLKDDNVMTTRNIIKTVIGDFSEPNTGIMFSIPITYVEGLGE